MPTYEFICDECEFIEIYERSIHHPQADPVHCGMGMRRMWTPIAAHFKGKGWGKDK